MFTIKESDDFEWPVDVKVPVSGGRFQTQRFTAVFRVLGEEDQNEIFELPLTKQNVAHSKKVWVGWGNDVLDESKEPIPFDEDTRDRLLDKPYIAAAVSQAYWDAMTGKKAERKN